MQGHVFNGHYLTWFDMAHTALLNEALPRSYEGLVASGGLGEQPGGGRRDGRRSPEALGSPAQAMGDQDLLHGRLGDGKAPVPEPVGVLATANSRLEHGQGQELFDHVGGGGPGHLGGSPGLGHQRVEAVAVRHALPLVVAGPRDAKGPAGLGHIADSGGVVQHGDAPLVDDLCWGHGDGLLGSLVGTTESIAGPLQGVDVQPHLMDWKL